MLLVIQDKPAALLVVGGSSLDLHCDYGLYHVQHVHAMTKTSTIAHLKGIHKAIQRLPADLVIVFEHLKKILSDTKFDLKARVVDRFHYEVWTEREVTIKSRRRKGVMFASIILYEHYVGFYFQPLYFMPELQEKIPDSLIPLQKGTTCFHFDNLSDSMIEDLSYLVMQGGQEYAAVEWI